MTLYNCKYRYLFVIAVTLPLLPAVHGNEPGSGNTVVPEQGSPSGFGGEELNAGLPGMQLKGMPGPKNKIKYD